MFPQRALEHKSELCHGFLRCYIVGSRKRFNAVQVHYSKAVLQYSCSCFGHNALPFMAVVIQVVKELRTVVVSIPGMEPAYADRFLRSGFLYDEIQELFIKGSHTVLVAEAFFLKAFLIKPE